MTKPTFAKLGLTKNIEVKTFTYNNQEIEVKQYLPIQDRLELIGNVVNQVLATDSNKFPNWLKLYMFLDLEIVFKYTNLTFTDKQKEDLPKLYDLLAGAGIFDTLHSVMPKNEYINLTMECEEALKGIHEYKNSAYGILETISQDYSNLNLDIDALTSKLANAENLDVVKDVVTKLG